MSKLDSLQGFGNCVKTERLKKPCEFVGRRNCVCVCVCACFRPPTACPERSHSQHCFNYRESNSAAACLVCPGPEILRILALPPFKNPAASNCFLLYLIFFFKAEVSPPPFGCITKISCLFLGFKACGQSVWGGYLPLHVCCPGFSRRRRRPGQSFFSDDNGECGTASWRGEAGCGFVLRLPHPPVSPREENAVKQ